MANFSCPDAIRRSQVCSEALTELVGHLVPNFQGPRGLELVEDCPLSAAGSRKLMMSDVKITKHSLSHQ